MEVNLVGKSIAFREEQPEKAESPIFVTLLGRRMVFKDTQLEKELSAISSNPSGKRIVFSFEQFSNPPISALLPSSK